MFVLAVSLLTGRYTATTFNDRSTAEWPPHPARLFSALVAAWADADEPSSAERNALRWLENQPPPELFCDPLDRVVHRSEVTHYVPVNDASALGREVIEDNYCDHHEAARQLASVSGLADKAAVKLRTSAQKLAAKTRKALLTATTAQGRESATVIASARQVLPGERMRQPRSFPTVRPATPSFEFRWPEVEPDGATFDALAALAGRVGRLGHASTLVAVEARRLAEGDPTFVPDPAGGDLPLRVPRAGLLDALDAQFARDRGVEPRTMPSGVARYRSGGPASPNARPLLGGDWIVLGLPRRDVDGAVQSRLRLTRTLDVARAVRGALLAHGPQPAPGFLTGHRVPGDPHPQPDPEADPGTGDGGGPQTTVSSRPHLAVVPLPEVASVHSGGILQAVALVLPADCRDEDRQLVVEAVRSWGNDGRVLRLGSASGAALSMAVDEPVVDPVWGGARRPGRSSRATARRSFWCRPSRTWVSATPVALDRFPGDLAARDTAIAERAEAAAAAGIARSCMLAGLPAPTSVIVSSLGLLTAVPAASTGRTDRRDRFPGFAAGASGQRRMTVHARIEFPDEVDGPVLLGAGRFLGYGLFLPVAEEPPGPAGVTEVRR